MGRPAPDHPGMLHHWQIGMAGLIMAQLGGLINLARSAITSSDMAENMPDSELYDESTVIDLPESSVSEEVEEAPPIPTPSLLEPQQEEILETPLEQTPNPPESKATMTTLQTIPSLPPLAKL